MEAVWYGKTLTFPDGWRDQLMDGEMDGSGVAVRNGGRYAT